MMIVDGFESKFNAFIVELPWSYANGKSYFVPHEKNKKLDLFEFAKPFAFSIVSHPELTR